MFFPIIPVGCAILALLGLSGLYWYDQLSAAEKEEADRLALGYAKQLYGAQVDELTQSQRDHVRALTKRHF